jgi:hypothetical protein
LGGLVVDEQLRKLFVIIQKILEEGLVDWMSFIAKIIHLQFCLKDTLFNL